MKKYEIVNYIEISGQDVRCDSLPKEEMRRIAQAMQDTVMGRLGYRRQKKAG